MKVRISDVAKTNANVYVDGKIMNFNKLNSRNKYNVCRTGSIIRSFIPIGGRPINIGIHKDSTFCTGTDGFTYISGASKSGNGNGSSAYTTLLIVICQ